MSKVPLRCKLKIGGSIIQKVINFSYLGADITSNGRLYREVESHILKVVRGYLKDIVFRIKREVSESKVRRLISTARSIQKKKNTPMKR